VSWPPRAQPQQSARVCTQSLSTVQPFAAGIAHSQDKQPVASIMYPLGQAAGHAIGAHASTHWPLSQAARTLSVHRLSGIGHATPSHARFAGSST
jgi:hypothetical protein